MQVSPPVWRGDEDVFELPEGRILRQRFFPEVVDAGAGDRVRLERGQESRLVDTAAAGDVDQIGALLHVGKGGGVDQLFGCRRQRAGEGDEIRLRQQCRQLLRRVDGIGGCGGGGRVALGRQHAHVERFGQPGQPRADLAQTDDQQGFAAQFIFALRQVADHAAPEAALLAVASAVDVAREGQDQGPWRVH